MNEKKETRILRKFPSKLLTNKFDSDTSSSASSSNNGISLRSNIFALTKMKEWVYRFEWNQFQPKIFFSYFAGKQPAMLIQKPINKQDMKKSKENLNVQENFNFNSTGCIVNGFQINLERPNDRARPHKSAWMNHLEWQTMIDTSDY